MLTQEQAEEQQRKNNETIVNANKFLLECYQEELKKPNPDEKAQKALEKLKKI